MNLIVYNRKHKITKVGKKYHIPTFNFKGSKEEALSFMKEYVEMYQFRNFDKDKKLKRIVKEQLKIFNYFIKELEKKGK